MARRVFHSFHFDKDFWRTQQVRNIGAITGDTPVSSNQWEEIKRSGSSAIKEWINKHLANKSCTIVLIGRYTAGRQWVKYEIKRTWALGKALLGIRIHKLRDNNGDQSGRGKNPFEDLYLGERKLSSIIPVYDPPYQTSKRVYQYISENISDWVEEAIDIRNEYS